MQNHALQGNTMMNARFQYSQELAVLDQCHRIDRVSNNRGLMQQAKQIEIKTQNGNIPLFGEQGDYPIGHICNTQYVAMTRTSSNGQTKQQQMNALENDIRTTIKNIDETTGVITYLDPRPTCQGGDILYIHEKKGTSAWSKRKKSSLQYRPKGQFLYEMIEAGTIEKVFISELSRLYRNMAYCAMFREQLVYEWKSKTDVFWPQNRQGLRDRQGLIAITIQMLLDEEESQQKSMRCGNAAEARRKAGTSTTGETFGWDRIPTGQFNSKDKEIYDMEPNWDEQAILEWARNEIEVNKESGVATAKKLDKLGIKGKTGGTWTSCTLLRALYKTKIHSQLSNYPRPNRMPSYPFTNYRKSIRL